MIDTIEDNKERPFLTIGIASYNYAEYLKKAFEAIQKQKFTDYEILYCDDGSTDDSVGVINEIIRENPQLTIRLVQGKNKGVMENKNRILKNAKGKYLMICDADDIMMEDCLDTLCGIAIKTQADQVVGAFLQKDSNGNILQTQEIPINLSRWIWGAHHATIYKMEIIKSNDLRFNNNCYPDDMYFNMIFHAHSKTFQFINKAVYIWNMHDDSTSAIKGKKDMWHGYPMLQSSLFYIKPISEEYENDENQQIEYTAIKMYCLAGLFRQRGSLKSFIIEYKKMKQLMDKTFPNYKKNKYCRRIDAEKIVRKKTAFIIWAYVLAERIHVILFLLTFYWLLSKHIKIVV